ncbi:hypothetical protein HNI00_05835 [Thermoleptolyngbya oregonensis NK1-22]|uniref:Uncharacterized protein n=1 Tax=Thermoleptolyngbya oregonensis NK1-22 TaxID=2547457 RepID=A0AA96Y6E6_9CYAN|nr:hypothetical protein [Thermoleptolyngbya oregonensis]WOB42723.1 hypothetical protein HNI00_05835 [Thermoleptolyngbya oregonensis NK1-22]
MPRRTSPNDLQHWEDASDLEHLVVDKRSHKRATPAKGRRRNRRYEKRLLNHYLENSDDLELGLDALNPKSSIQNRQSIGPTED